MTEMTACRDCPPAVPGSGAARTLAFPIAAATLTPHARPMLAVDQVLCAEAGAGQVALRAQPGAWYMRDDGRWDEVAGIELISQAAAAVSGITPPVGAAAPPVCFLAEVRQYRVRGDVRAGDDLVIDIRKAAEFGGFFVTDGELRRGAAVLATAALTFWRDDRPQPGRDPERPTHA